MRRSVLFTPGNRPERIAKALAAGVADVVVADLEDAVPPGEKEAAREAVATVLREAEGPKHGAAPGGEAAVGPRPERAVRINAWPSVVADADVDAAVAAGAGLLVVPKAAEPEAVAALAERVLQAEQDARREAGEVGLLLILETAEGVLRAGELARCERVRAIAFGAEDLAADVGMRRSAENQEVAVPRSLVSLAAAAAGVQAIDMITADFRDLDRTGREAREARALGYAGKMVLHPAQVAVVHDAFRPTEEELAWAKRVVAASAQGGVAVVDGRMIDAPLVAQARAILQEGTATPGTMD